jgi:hypothetical protein
MSEAEISYVSSIGGDGMKEYNFGNTKVIVYSDVWCMEEEERKEWIREETEKGNQVLANIREAIKDCYRKHD